MRNGGIVVLLLTGCASHSAGIRPLRPLELAAAPYQETVTDYPAGSLMYEGGCLLFRDSQTKAQLMPVWPIGSIFNGTSVNFHQPGKSDQPVLVGEMFVMEGRPAQWSELPVSAYAPFQNQCAAPPFFVSGVRPAD